jgi:hypothetical protein
MKIVNQIYVQVGWCNKVLRLNVCYVHNINFCKHETQFDYLKLSVDFIFIIIISYKVSVAHT